MLKGTAEAITPTVTHLFNLSLKSGEVPEAWKTSVVSIPKTHRPSDNPIDYRPISLLSTVSKLLEKHVYKLLLWNAESARIVDFAIDFVIGFVIDFVMKIDLGIDFGIDFFWLKSILGSISNRFWNEMKSIS